MSDTTGSRFVVKKIPDSPWSRDAAHILVDTFTGVNYLVVSAGFGGGITPLLDSSGNVVVDKKYTANRAAD